MQKMRCLYGEISTEIHMRTRLLSLKQHAREVIIHIVSAAPPFFSHPSSFLMLMYVDTGTRIYQTTRASQIIRVTARSETHLLRAPTHRVFLSHLFLFRHVRALFPLESCARKKVAIEANAGCRQNRESFLHGASQGKGIRRKQRA